jgi:glycosyltransferase involved in cell wall biosynthesis
MQKPKRIFAIADFKDESSKSIRIERRRWPKGFIRLGHDVQRFSYRNVLTQFNPFSGRHFRRFVPRFVKQRADNILVEQVAKYHPDIIFVGGMKYLDRHTISAMRSVAANAVFVGRDNDPFPERNPDRISIARQMDIVTVSNAGRFMDTYKEAGVPICAFVPNPCDPDIQRPYDVGPEWKSDIVFTGKAEHKRLGAEVGREKDRYELLQKLSTMPNARMYGCFGNPRVEGIEVFYAFSGAKIALSINIVNDVRLYHSDRLVNCLSCGTFTLAKRVPDTDLLFEDGVHLRYFDTAREFFDLVEHYLGNESERARIAAAGMQKAHTDFSCEQMARCVLDLVEKGSYDAPWACVVRA